jgi:hypothetical protein
VYLYVGWSNRHAARHAENTPYLVRSYSDRQISSSAVLPKSQRDVLTGLESDYDSTTHIPLTSMLASQNADNVSRARTESSILNLPATPGRSVNKSTTWLNTAYKDAIQYHTRDSPLAGSQTASYVSSPLTQRDHCTQDFIRNQPSVGRYYDVMDDRCTSGTNVHTPPTLFRSVETKQA